jgi:hypothetical protein
LIINLAEEYVIDMLVICFENQFVTSQPAEYDNKQTIYFVICFYGREMRVLALRE